MIKDAKDTKLNANSGTLPNLSGALLGWFQALTMGVVQKDVVNFQVIETVQYISFLGVLQPMSATEISRKPEGQRAWQWYTIHSDTSLDLKLDDVITYRAVQYRVHARTDYGLYGYIEYQIAEDWTGAGPT